MWAITLRLPCELVGMAGPSSKRGLVPHADGTAGTVPVNRIGLVVETGTGAGTTQLETTGIGWEPWQRVYYRERVKAGVQQLVYAFGRGAAVR
ncbi:MAG: hypothetical protein HYR62_06805 [Actinobacteria bacterium]|nr:hypothetical protein [Actinomycetota bacterium]MBI3688293.1 hypothetical protein [Actinomycetota bacterium]